MGFNQNKLLGTLLLSLAQFASATTWYVNGVTGSDSNNCKSANTACKSIGHAISLASSGDTIKVAAATYKENLTIAISLKISGAAAKTTIIDGGALNSVVTISSTSAHVALSSLTIQNGSAEWGGGIYNNGVLEVTNSVLSGNLSKGKGFRGGQGGGVINWGTLSIKNSILSRNKSSGPSGGIGGGIYNDGTTVIIGSVLSGNSTAGSGGGIYSPGGNLTVNQTTVSGNSAGVQGGGIDSNSTLTVGSSTFSGNVSGNGGAIINGGTATINNSTLTDNSAYNSAGGSGGGILNTGNVTISSSTLTLNKSGSGGGIYGSLGTVTLQNSIVANNTGGNCNGAMTSDGYNLSSDSTCSFNGPGDMNNIDPRLGPLQNNGGPTETMSELQGSPTIDAGNPSGCTDGQGHLLKTDQRGFPRPDKEDVSGCDMGAYERQSD